jgi:hypothetical protein
MMHLDDKLAEMIIDLDAIRTRLETATLRHTDELRELAADLRSLRNRIERQRE